LKSLIHPQRYHPPQPFPMLGQECAQGGIISLGGSFQYLPGFARIAAHARPFRIAKRDQTNWSLRELYLFNRAPEHEWDKENLLMS
jgi:hypothetical protein